MRDLAARAAARGIVGGRPALPCWDPVSRRLAALIAAPRWPEPAPPTSRARMQRAAGPTPWSGPAPSPDLGDLELTVGSKSSAEQEILGWIAVEALRAAGADVQEEIALGSTVVIREAELAGLIDLYWEYTGTGWVELLQQTGPSSDPDELYGAVREVDEEENGIEWLEPAPRTADTRS